MKLLLTGVLPWSVWIIAQRLARGGHDITVVGAAEAPAEKPAGVRHVPLDLEKKETTRYITAGGFDAVLFFFACQCEDPRDYGAVQGSQLDVMFDILHGSAKTSVRQFVLITDQRVFGAAQTPDEDEIPVPDTPTGIMIKAAESCVSCGVSGDIKTLIVRTTSLYAPGDPDSFFAQAALCAKNGQPWQLRGTADTPCDFLHAEDFGVLLEHAVSMELEGVLHAPQGIPATYGEICGLMENYLPGLNPVYLGGERCAAALRSHSAAALGWVPRHDYRQELETLCVPQTAEKQKKRLRLPGGNLGWEALKWAEVVLMGLLAAWLTKKGESNALLATVDYMLLYVAVIGFVHGRTAGTTASVLACLWYAYSFISKGNAASDLLYNTDHWLPMSVYILCGSLFGYAQDRQRVKVELLQKEQEELQREKEFVEGIYQSTYEDRNQLKEQIYHYRDSYGRIYQITRELDSLQPVQVFLSTLHVLESTLQNSSVAIYECKPESAFIRLVVRSREMQQLPRSINLNDYAPMRERLREGKLFANHTFMNGYPVYALPVMDGEDIMAVLMLWNVSFEQQSVYMENLLSVVAGLVQSALARAIQYHRQVDDLYYENTHILTPEAFRAALGVYQTIRQRRTGEHVLVRLKAERSMDMELIDRYIGKLVRSTDVVGCLDDGCYYVLFPQATTDRIPAIDVRFNTYGLKCEVISEDVSLG